MQHLDYLFANPPLLIAAFIVAVVVMATPIKFAQLESRIKKLEDRLR